MKRLTSNMKAICTERFRRFTVARLTVVIDPDRRSSRRSMFGASTPPAGPQHSFDRKRWKISTEPSVWRLKKIARHHRDGLIAFAMAVKLRRPSERFNKRTETLSSARVTSLGIFTDWK